MGTIQRPGDEQTRGQGADKNQHKLFAGLAESERVDMLFNTQKSVGKNLHWKKTQPELEKKQKPL